MKSFKSTSALLLCGTALSMVAAPAFAQAQNVESAEQPADDTAEEEAIVVTGYRASLESAAATKREATNFTESVSAEDIGKFPDLNLAESLQRLPGIQISRDSSSGEGTQVRVRGLGPSFTRVTLNGTPLNPATDGGIRANSNGREVDLNLLPTELFNKLEVSKSAQANKLEGGLSTVNLRPASAFDKEGSHFYASINGNYGSAAKRVGYGGSLIYSNTWENFGLLVGVVGNKRAVDNTAYWSSNWTNANLACAGCDNTQSNQFTFATTVPANAGNGLVAGTPITLATLLQLNPGVTANQLTNGFIPRADRHSVLTGTSERATALVSLDWRPSEALEFRLSAVANKTKTDTEKANSNWYVRSSSPTTTGGMVPINLVIDENNIIRSGRFANSNFFTIQENTSDDSYFWHINPSLVWRPTEKLDVKLDGHYSESRLERDYAQLWITTLLNRGITATYDFPVGQVSPTVSFDFDLADPNSGIWTWDGNVLTRESRDTFSKGGVLEFGYDIASNFRASFGGAYDHSGRSIAANQVQVTAALFAQIPQPRIAEYLTVVRPRGIPNEGYRDFVTVDGARVFADTNISSLLDAAPSVLRTSLGTAVGKFEEKVKSAFVQFSGESSLFGSDLRFDAGIRYVHTDQLVSGPVNLGGTISFQERNTSYDAWLPSVNLAYEPIDSFIIRAAASKTMTRANPQQILPGTVITDVAVQNANAGNPDLTPFFSSNLDLGLEYYLGKSGYIAVNGFMKRVNGFTTTIRTTRAFGDLGIPISSLLPVQQTAVNAAGGLAAPVIVNQPINTDVIKLKGFEAAWSQPLDFIQEGLGFNASFTYVDDGDTNIPTSISPRIYNLIGYYDSDAFEARVSWVRQSSRQLSGAPTNGFTNIVIEEAGRSQVDVSASYKFNIGGRDFRISFDGTNVFKTRTDSFITDNANIRLPLELNDPGSQYRLELSVNF